MPFSRNIRDQLKKLTPKDLIRALKKDGWQEDVTRGATRAFVKTSSASKRVVIHYHPSKTKTYGWSLLASLLTDIGWTETDLRRLKLIR